MKVLIIKMSSMGDVVHTLPALTEAGQHFPTIQFDWVVEEAFSEIPQWHPLVNKIIIFPWRRIRKNPFSRDFFKTIKQFKKQLQTEQYDYVIDAQGLLKSALITYFSRGLRCGYDARSAREKIASYFYKKCFLIEKCQHAITRIRKLFASTLGYEISSELPDAAIHLQEEFKKEELPYVVFLHGTTWKTKHWPENYWIALGKKINSQGLKVKLPWGNTIEKESAERIFSEIKDAEVLPKLSLTSLARLLLCAKWVIGVDTGLSHLAAALNVPTITVYGPTNAALTGTQGKNQIHLASQFRCAPCLKSQCYFVGEKPVDPPCFFEINPESVIKEMNK